MPTKTDIEHLNDTVKKITEILKPYAKSTAQMKVDKEDELKVKDKEEKLTEERKKLFKEQEKLHSQKKVGFFDLARFISVEAKLSFDRDRINHATWGKLGETIKVGTKEWFDRASKQRGLLGATLRLGSSLWKATHEHVIGTIKRVFGAVTGQIREVLGEMAGVFDFVKNIFMSGFRFITGNKQAFLLNNIKYELFSFSKISSRGE